MSVDLPTGITVAERVRWLHSSRASTARERLFAFEIGNEVFELMSERVREHSNTPSMGLHKVVGSFELSWNHPEFGPRDVLHLAWRLTFRSGHDVTGVVLNVRTTGTPTERSSRVHVIATGILKELRKCSERDREDNLEQHDLQVASVTMPVDIPAPEPAQAPA